MPAPPTQPIRRPKLRLHRGRSGGLKSEIRRPKPEIRINNPDVYAGRRALVAFIRPSGFGLRSALGPRISDFITGLTFATGCDLGLVPVPAGWDANNRTRCKWDEA